MPQMEMLLNCTAVKQAASIVVTTACPPLRCVLPLPAPRVLSWSAAELCQIFPLPISRYRFKFQSNLVWDSIKSISNFCFQFNEKSK
jgi:hypothetical protein